MNGPKTRICQMHMPSSNKQLEGLAEDPKTVLSADRVVSVSLAQDRISDRLLGKGN